MVIVLSRFGYCPPKCWTCGDTSVTTSSCEGHLNRPPREQNKGPRIFDAFFIIDSFTEQGSLILGPLFITHCIIAFKDRIGRALIALVVEEATQERMMRPISPKDEEDNPEPKRPKRDAENGDGRERVRIATPEHIQALSQVVDNRRAELEQAEADARKAELQVFHNASSSYVLFSEFHCALSHIWILLYEYSYVSICMSICFRCICICTCKFRCRIGQGDLLQFIYAARCTCVNERASCI